MQDLDRQYLYNRKERDIRTQKHRHAQEKMAMRTWKQKLELSSYKSRNSEDGQQAPEAGKGQVRVLPQSLQWEHGPANSVILDF